MKKKTIVIVAAAVAVAVLALVLLLLFGGNAQYHCECGAKQFSTKNDKTPKDASAQCAEGCSGENLCWKPLGENALGKEGNYYLDSDAALDQELRWEQADAPGTLRLDLKGYTLSLGAAGMFWLDQPESALVITDTAGSGAITTEKTGAVLRLKAGAVRHFGGILRGAEKEDAKAPEKGGVVLMEGGAYCLSGGSIQGGKADFGGTVAVIGSGAFAMHDGTISGGVAGTSGGNVAVMSSDASFSMSGGLIEGGSIAGNKTQLGGNMTVMDGGKLHISGGELRGSQNADDSSLFVNGSSTVEVEGSARFTGEAKCIYLQGSGLNVSGGSFESAIEYNSGDFKVSGGSFRQDVSAWITEGNTVVYNPNGIYTINSPCVAMVGKVGYTQLADAMIDAVKEGELVKLEADHTSSDALAIPGNALLDLNGFDINCDVQIKTGGTLRVFDSQTDDFTVATGNDRDYGMIQGKVTGELSLDHTLSDDAGASRRYLAVSHDGAGYSFHRVELEVSSVRLVGEKSAMGIETALRCDAVVADWVTSYGISVAAADKNGVESDFGKPVAGTDNKKVYQTAEIISLANSVEANNTAAKVDYTAYAYLKTACGTVKSGEVKTNFLQVVADTNRALAGTTMTQAQIDELDKLYRTYRSAITAWDNQMEPIRNYSAKLYQVGYAAVNVDPTPDMYGKVGLMGYGNEATRLVTSVDSQSPLMAICLAITDSKGETVVLISVDSATVGGEVAKTIVSGVAAQCGVPEGHIMINSNHQHSTPVFGGVYDKHFTDQVISGVKQAMEDRKTVLSMDVQRVKVSENTYNFVRNRQYVDANGKAVPGAMKTDNHDDKTRADLAGLITANVTYESTADNEVQLLKIARAGDEKDILLVNFQTHPHLGGGSSNTKATADIVGILRDRLDARLNCRTMYFSGAGGNINPTGSNYIACGAGLATELAEAIDADNWVSAMGDATDGVGAVTKTCQYDVMLNSVPSWLRTTNPEFAGLSDAEIMKKIVAHTYKFWDGSKYLVNSTSEDLNKYGIYSKYHAKYIQQRDTNKYGDTRSLTISTLSFGDIGFVVAPYEMFDTNGQELKAQSPFEMTFITTLADMPTAKRASLGNGYIPSALGYRNGGYSADISRYAAGTGEALVRDFLAMLHELNNR